jgi:hypothetical protein
MRACPLAGPVVAYVKRLLSPASEAMTTEVPPASGRTVGEGGAAMQSRAPGVAPPFIQHRRPLQAQ